MSDEKRFIGVRLPEDFDVGKIDEACREYGVSKSRLAQEGLKIIMNMHPDLYHRVLSMADRMRVPSWSIIQSMVAHWCGQYDAELKVKGSAAIGHWEFGLDANFQPVDGITTYKTVYFNHLAFYTSEKIEELLVQEADGDIPLTEEERAFLTKHRTRQGS